jgi:hypothetical protein
MTDDTEKQLLTFLHEQRTSDISGTLKTIVNWTTSHEAKDDIRHEELRGDIRGHSLRIGVLEKTDEKHEERLDQSGSWQVDAVKARAMLAEANASSWRTHAVTIIVGLVMLILGGVSAAIIQSVKK